MSGAFIELQPGVSGEVRSEFALLDSSPHAKEICILLDSERSGQLNAGDPVLFRAYRVGSVETSEFDTKARQMRYQLFITAPYDGLVTSNARF